MATAVRSLPARWPLDYQMRVNAILLNRKLRAPSQGRGLLSPDELDALELAHAAGESAESFVARITAPPPAISFGEAQRRLSRLLTDAGIAHTLPRPALVRTREEDH